MFTIKYCHDFQEQLFHSCEDVRANLNQAGLGYGVHFQSPAGLHHTLGDDDPTMSNLEKGQRGVVFVMNDSGKTVATYHV